MEYQNQRRLNHILKNFLGNYVLKEESISLKLNTKLSYRVEKIFPGYLSDRERLVVILNQFQKNQDREKLIYWTDFFDGRKTDYTVHYFLGLMSLNEFLKDVGHRHWLLKSISHFKMAHEKVTIECLAFTHYLNRDYGNSLRYIKMCDCKKFTKDFSELILRIS
jgi:hypothetical protein